MTEGHWMRAAPCRGVRVGLFATSPSTHKSISLRAFRYYPFRALVRSSSFIIKMLHHSKEAIIKIESKAAEPPNICRRSFFIPHKVHRTLERKGKIDMFVIMRKSWLLRARTKEVEISIDYIWVTVRYNCNEKRK
jgi:hypothetical protein